MEMNTHVLLRTQKRYSDTLKPVELQLYWERNMHAVGFIPLIWWQDYRCRMLINMPNKIFWLFISFNRSSTETVIARYIFLKITYGGEGLLLWSKTYISLSSPLFMAGLWNIAGVWFQHFHFPFQIRPSENQTKKKVERFPTTFISLFPGKGHSFLEYSRW